MLVRIKKYLSMVLGATLVCLMLTPAVFAFNPQPEPPGLGAITGLHAFVKGNSDIKFNPTVVTPIVSHVHGDFIKQFATGKITREQAVQQQIQYLKLQTNIQDVTELPGGNLFVHFKGGYPLIMLLNPTPPTTLPNVQSIKSILPVSNIGIINPGKLQPIFFAQKHPSSNKALVFDCIDNDVWAVPHISNVVAQDLTSMNYQVTTKLNNDANLANAAQIGSGNYGVIYLRGHGGVMPNGFGILTRPWSNSPMPWDSGYTGTWPVSFTSYNGNGNGVTKYGYAITGEFAAAYWTQTFPGTMFYLMSCHGADPAGVSGLPDWTLNHGAGAWIGYDDDILFSRGDPGSKLFFDDMAKWDDAATGVADVEAAGLLPPNLLLLPSGDNYTLNNRVAKVTISPRIINLKVGAKGTFTATVSPSNAYNTTVKWTSDNTAVATVDSKGVVTAIKAGYCHITATTVGTWSSGYPSADSVTVDVTK